MAETKQLWKEIDKSGLSKVNFLDTEKGKKWDVKNYRGDCPCCDYDYQYSRGACKHCPIYIKYGKTCSKLGYKLHRRNKRFFKAIKNL